MQNLAEKIGCPVELLRVIEPASVDPTGHIRHRYQMDLSLALHSARESLNQIRARLMASGVEVSTSAYAGNPANVILDEADKDPGTLIAMSTHGRSGAARWLMGSVTDKILHTTANPLLAFHVAGTTRCQPEVNLKTIIVPLDGSALAEQVLRHAVPLAKALDLIVNLVQVTPSEAEYYRQIAVHPMDGAPGLYHPPFQKFSLQANAEAVEYLRKTKDMLRKQGITSVKNTLLHGHPTDAIVALARQTSDNLVAMTTHGRSGIGRWALGSVTDRVVRLSGDPVLVVQAIESKKGE